MALRSFMKIVKTNRAFFIWPCKFGATELGVEVLDEEEKEEAKTTSSSMGEAPQTIKIRYLHHPRKRFRVRLFLVATRGSVP